jgi:HlyD family secretion protein
MKKYLTRGRLVFLVLILVGGVLTYLQTTREQTPDWVTGTVTMGTVQEIVSVSGVIEAEGEALLSFPVTGVVEDILVEEGASVMAGDVLATLEQDELIADRKDAHAALLIAEANRTELITGVRTEARDVTDAEVRAAEANLLRTISEESQKVANAYRTLLSEDLEALPINRATEAVPPVVTGTYTCKTEGTYTLTVFSSGAKSGYSYRLEGLESGTFSAYTEAPAPLGFCGLSIQFDADSSYGGRTWEVTIPNTRGASYTANANAYALALEGERNAVAQATETLEQAKLEQSLENAVPREEALARADAAVIQAEARIASIDARIKERTLRAPFDGVVSAIEISEGEVATGEAMTVIAADIYELTVRVPEIDITKLTLGQTAQVRFDARPSEIMTATVRIISETATEIDGVAYFEATLRFETTPTWFRSGLNADVHIIVDEKQNTLKVPKRFVTTENGTHFVLVPNGVETARKNVDVTFTGNDGFVALEGNINEGDVVVAP